MSAPSRSQQQPPRGASLQDCLFYAGPSGCRNGTACKYRHQLNAEQTRGARPCHKWEANGCQRMDCKFRHGAKTDHGATAQPKQQHSTKSRIEKAAHPVAAAASAGGPPVPASAGPRPIALFWDLENCALPRGCDAFLLVQLLRHHLVTDRRCQEVLFNAYCDAAVLGRKHQEALHHANVRLHSIPATKPGAVDFALLLDLDRFTHSHSPPATIVLLSGDIDFVGKVHMLRHQQGYNVVLVHNAVAKRELKLSANEVIEYKYFTTKLGNGAAPSATAGAPEKETKQKTGSKGELAAAAANQQPKQKQQQPQQQPKPKSKQPSTSAPPSGAAVPATQPKLKKATASVDAQVCRCCDGQFPSFAALWQHQQAKEHWACSFCARAPFQSQQALMQHWQTKHPDEVMVQDAEESSDEGAEYVTCAVCGNEFNGEHGLQQHQQAKGHYGSAPSGFGRGDNWQRIMQRAAVQQAAAAAGGRATLNAEVARMPLVLHRAGLAQPSLHREIQLGRLRELLHFRRDPADPSSLSAINLRSNGERLLMWELYEQRLKEHFGTPFAPDAASSSPEGEPLLYVCSMPSLSWCNRVCEGRASLERHYHMVHSGHYIVDPIQREQPSDFAIWKAYCQQDAFTKLTFLSDEQVRGGGCHYTAGMAPPRILGMRRAAPGSGLQPCYTLQCQLCDGVLQSADEYATHFYKLHLEKPVHSSTAAAERSVAAAHAATGAPIAALSSATNLMPSLEDVGLFALAAAGATAAAVAAVAVASKLSGNGSLSPGEEGSEQWTCSRCTYTNSKEDHRCKMCAQPSPSR